MVLKHDTDVDGRTSNDQVTESLENERRYARILDSWNEEIERRVQGRNQEGQIQKEPRLLTSRLAL